MNLPLIGESQARDLLALHFDRTSLTLNEFQLKQVDDFDSDLMSRLYRLCKRYTYRYPVIAKVAHTGREPYAVEFSYQEHLTEYKVDGGESRRSNTVSSPRGSERPPELSVSHSLG